MPELILKKKKMSSFEMIAFGFAGVILLGAIILMLPISSSAGVVTTAVPVRARFLASPG